MGPIDYVSGLLPTNDSIVQSIGQGMQLRAAYDQQQLLKQQQAAALAAQQKYEQDKAAIEEKKKAHKAAIEALNADVKAGRITQAEYEEKVAALA